MKHILLFIPCLLATVCATGQDTTRQQDTLKALSLKGITVKGERPKVTVRDGRFTIDMRAIRANKIAANAHELIKELPLVDCPENEELELRGAQATKVMINGKPSNLNAEQITRYLKTLPADKVEKVELLHNPPAEYHVTNASVINVITKRFAGNELSGQLTGRYKNRHNDAFGSDAAASFSTPHWNFDAMFSYDHANTLYKQKQYSRHTLTGAPTGETDRVYDIRLTNKSHPIHDDFYIHAAAGRKFNDKSELNIGYTGNFTPDYSSPRKTVNNMFGSAVSDNDDVSRDHDISADYTSAFGLQTGIAYNYWQTNGVQSMEYDGMPAFNYRTRQRIDNYKVYADQTHKLAKGWKLSYGAMFNFVQNDNLQNMRHYDNANDSYRTATATYESTTDAYAGTGKAWNDGKIMFDATLTLGHYRINHDRETDLMPRATFTWNVAPQHMLQLSYNTYKEYPSYWEKQDYTTRRDEYMIMKGNPLLKPAKHQNLIFQYIFKNKYVFTARYRNIHNFFTNQSFQSPDELTLVYQWRNIKKTENFYFSLTAPVKFGKVAYSDFTAATYNQRYKENDWFSLKYNRSKWAAYLANRTVFYLNTKKTFTADFDVFYQSAAIQGVWDTDAHWCMNAGLKYKFLKDKAMLSLRCNDIFQSAMPEIKVRFGTQWQNLRQNYYQRSVNVSFTYNFGGYKERAGKQPDLSRYGR